MDGFETFSFGSGDSSVGQRSKRFKAETGRSYRVSFVWFNNYTDDGMIADGATMAFAGCERIYKPGLGYVLIDNSNRAAMLELLGEQPRQAIASIICVWPTDKDGEIDVASFKAGKGYALQPWVFSPDKYRTIGQVHKRFSLMSHDVTLSCSDGQYQKMTFTPESESLLHKYLSAKNEDLQAVGRKIISDARLMANNINGELARSLSVDEVREKLGGSPASPTGNHSSKNVDDLLDGIGI